MKKFLTILLSVLMIASLCAFQVSADDAKVVYVGVGETWEEKGTGTKEDPYSKLSMAIKALAKVGGEIVLLTDIDLFYEYTNDVSEGEPNPSVIGDIATNGGTPFHLINPRHEAPITIRSESGARIRFKGGRHQTSWTMNGPTTFKNVTLDFSNGSYRRVYSNGYDLVFDEGTTSSGTYIYPGMSPNATDADRTSRIIKETNVVLKAGNWNYLFGSQFTNCEDDLVTNYYLLGSASITGYAAIGPMNGISFKEANLFMDTTGSIATLHAGFDGKNGSINMHIKNGSITSAFNCNMEIGGGTKELKAINVNYMGGKIYPTIKGTGSTAKSTNLNVLSGATAPKSVDMTIGVLGAPASMDPPSNPRYLKTDDAKIKASTKAQIKPETDIVINLDTNTDGGLVVFKKGYDFSFNKTTEEDDTKNDWDPEFTIPDLDEEGKIKIDEKTGEEQYLKITYGTPLYRAGFEKGAKSVTLTKTTDGVIETRELEGLSVGEYVVYVYGVGYEEPLATVEFTVTENPVNADDDKPGELPDTGDEIVFVAIAAIVSAMAAAFVLRRKAI